MSVDFTRSLRYTMGTELELQLIDKTDSRLSDKADIVLTDIKNRKQIKHELTKSMIELNSSVHSSVSELYKELTQIARNVRDVARSHHCEISGGGRHPDSAWREQIISDLQRHQRIADRYGYISKMACVFGQHIHIGVDNGDEAIYLCHALLPYLSHLVALSASSPWQDGEDTCFASSRFTGQNSFLNSELPECVYRWEDFTAFYDELLDAGVITGIRDIYWYVRPQPGLGTVEVRICDMPLTIYHAVMLTGYCKMLVRFLLHNRQVIIKKHRAIDKYNIFNARRDGLQASYVDERTQQRQPLSDHLLHTLDAMVIFAKEEEDHAVLQYIRNYVQTGVNDANRIRNMIHHAMVLDVVMEQMRKMLFTVPPLCRRSQS